jgi:hypothetical protein
MKTIYKVYWTQNGMPDSGDFDVLTEALDATAYLRKQGCSFVTMVSENVDHVGLIGVDSVKDGVCPDGEAFLGRTSRYSLMLKRGR